jgi:hypothetical protein
MVASRERTIFQPEYPDKNDLPDNESSLPGSILEHIANAVVYAAIRRWNRVRHRAVRLPALRSRIRRERWTSDVAIKGRTGRFWIWRSNSVAQRVSIMNTTVIAVSRLHLPLLSFLAAPT